MTDSQYRAAVASAIERFTQRHSGSAAAARKALSAGGVYTKKGQLRVAFGGERKKSSDKD